MKFGEYFDEFRSGFRDMIDSLKKRNEGGVGKEVDIGDLERLADEMEDMKKIASNLADAIEAAKTASNDLNLSIQERQAAQRQYLDLQKQAYDHEELAKALSVSEDEIRLYFKARGLKTEEPKVTGKFHPTLNFHPDVYFISIVILIAFIIGIICFDTKLYVSGDNAIFIELGNKIAAGKGMEGHTQYPFLFPLIFVSFYLFCHYILSCPQKFISK